MICFQTGLYKGFVITEFPMGFAYGFLSQTFFLDVLTGFECDFCRFGIEPSTNSGDIIWL